MKLSGKSQNLPLVFTSDSIESPIWQGDGLYISQLKRVLDVVLVLLFLPFVLPVIGLLMAIIKLDSKGPALYQCERIGYRGKKFSIFKLRTMCVNADEKLAQILREHPSLREEWEVDHKLRNDPRITRVGNVIRTLSLDELPQIFNVLKGEMSLVGPRPIVDAEVEKYGKHFAAYKSVRPGITGLWQVSGRNDTSYDSRVILDKYYSKNVSFVQDMKILLKTIPATFSKKGAY